MPAPTRPTTVDSPPVQTHYYDQKFADMDTRMSGIESGQAVMSSSLAATNAAIVDVKQGIQQIFNRMDRDRTDDSNRPSSVRTSTLFQVVALLVGSTGLVTTFMFFWIGPVKEAMLDFKEAQTRENAAIASRLDAGLYRADKESASRHAEQQAWIDRHQSMIDATIAAALVDAKWRGMMEERSAGLRDDIDAQKEDLRVYSAEERQRIGDLLKPLNNDIERIDTNGSTGVLQMLREGNVPTP